MNQRDGTDKTAAKIAILDGLEDRHRPDADTKKDDEWNREYELFEDEMDDAEVDNTMHGLTGKKDLASNADKDEALEDIESHLCGKADPGASGSGGSGKTEEAKVKVEGAVTDEDLKTFKAIQDNPKKVLTTIGSSISEIKGMIQITNQPDHVKHSEVVRTDLSKLLPKFKTDFTNVEKVFLAKSNGAPCDDPQVLAIARKIDANYELYNDASDWYTRICKPKKAKKT